MSTPSLPTFDLSVPRRPGVDDVGGAAKIEDAQYPADPTTMVTAADVNQWSNLLVAMGKVMPVLVISIAVSAGVYSVGSFSCASNNVTLGTFTVTKNGTGDVTVTWPSNTFPTPVCQPVISLNGPLDHVDAAALCLGVTNGFHAITQTDSSPDDMSFTVLLF